MPLCAAKMTYFQGDLKKKASLAIFVQLGSQGVVRQVTDETFPFEKMYLCESRLLNIG